MSKKKWLFVALITGGGLLVTRHEWDRIEAGLEELHRKALKASGKA